MKIIMPLDPFYITQIFGVNPQNYSQFGLKGHNGWDLRTKYPDSPDGKRVISSPESCEFYRKGNDPNGYGTYVEIVTRPNGKIFRHLFGHCDSIHDFTTQSQGGKLAVSDNTGNSSAPHTHWTVKELNTDLTIKNYNNGYFGAIDPQIYIDWVKSSPEPQPPMDNNIKKATQFDQVLNYLKDVGYITDNDSNHYLDGQFLSLIKNLHSELVSNRGRAGKWDQLCNKAGISGDTNVITVEQLFEKIQTSGNAETLRQKILEFVKTA